MVCDVTMRMIAWSADDRFYRCTVRCWVVEHGHLAFRFFGAVRRLLRVNLSLGAGSAAPRYESRIAAAAQKAPCLACSEGPTHRTPSAARARAGVNGRQPVKAAPLRHPSSSKANFTWVFFECRTKTAAQICSSEPNTMRQEKAEPENGAVESQGATAAPRMDRRGPTQDDYLFPPLCSHAVTQPPTTTKPSSSRRSRSITARCCYAAGAFTRRRSPNAASRSPARPTRSEPTSHRRWQVLRQEDERQAGQHRRCAEGSRPFVAAVDYTVQRCEQFESPNLLFLLVACC